MKTKEIEQRQNYHTAVTFLGTLFKFKLYKSGMIVRLNRYWNNNA